nr:MAG TPA: hypothetical protein [Caudoviricetes sp.]
MSADRTTRQSFQREEPQEERCLHPLDSRPLSRARRSLVGESGRTPPRSFCGVAAPN